jgi:hypothetical protein
MKKLDLTMGVIGLGVGIVIGMVVVAYIRNAKTAEQQQRIEQMYIHYEAAHRICISDLVAAEITMDVHDLFFVPSSSMAQLNVDTARAMAEGMGVVNDDTQYEIEKKVFHEVAESLSD